MPRAFATVECIPMTIVALLATGAATLPRFNTAAADAPVAGG